MVLNYYRQMGPRYHPQRPCPRVCKNSASFSSQGPTSSSSKGTAPPDSANVAKGSDRTRPSIAKGNRFLFQVLPGKEKIGGLAPDSGSSLPKQIHKETFFSHAITQRCPSTSSSGRFFGNTRSSGRVLPCADSTLSQEVFVVQGGWQGLSIQSSPVRIAIRPSGLHKGLGAGGSLPSSSGSSNFPILRRLPDKGQLSLGRQRLYSEVPKSISVSGINDQLRQIPSQSFSSHNFPRYLSRHSTGSSVCLSGETTKNFLHGPRTTNKQVHFSTAVQVFSRNGLILHSSDSSFSAPHAAASGRTHKPMAAGDRVFRRPYPHNIQNATSPRLVGEKSKSSRRLPLSKGRANISHHHGRISGRVGRSPSRITNQRALDRSAANFPYQSARVASNISRPKGFSISASRTIGIDKNRQYNKYALHKQTGGNEFCSAVEAGAGNMGLGYTPSDYFDGSACSGSLQHPSRLPQQIHCIES